MEQWDLGRDIGQYVGSYEGTSIHLRVSNGISVISKKQVALELTTTKECNATQPICQACLPLSSPGLDKNQINTARYAGSRRKEMQGYRNQIKRQEEGQHD
jgi:hypothetical protein